MIRYGDGLGEHTLSPRALKFSSLNLCLIRLDIRPSFFRVAVQEQTMESTKIPRVVKISNCTRHMEPASLMSLSLHFPS